MRTLFCQNFNTSHVSINPSCNCGEYDRFYHFNTSHVSINPARSNGAAAGKKISIHLMFLLIFSDVLHWQRTAIYFNTSHVSINPITTVRRQKIIINFNTSHVSINPTLLSAFPFLLYLKFLENTSFFKFFPSVSRT